MLSPPPPPPPPPPPSGSGSKKPESDPRPNKAQSKWKTVGQQRVYNRRLLDALRNPQPTSSARAIKEAADSALALTAHGQSRWSRAILSSRRVLLKTAASARRRRPSKPNKKPPPPKEPPTKDGKVNERLRALGRLVPGCRKLAAPSLLKETADYMAALELQVSTMRALAAALSARET